MMILSLFLIAAFSTESADCTPCLESFPCEEIENSAAGEDITALIPTACTETCLDDAFDTCVPDEETAIAETAVGHACYHYTARQIRRNYRWIGGQFCIRVYSILGSRYCGAHNTHRHVLAHDGACGSNEEQSENSAAYSVLAETPVVKGFAMIGLVSIGVFVGLKFGSGNTYKEVVEV